MPRASTSLALTALLLHAHLSTVCAADAESSAAPVESVLKGVSTPAALDMIVYFDDGASLNVAVAVNKSLTDVSAVVAQRRADETGTPLSSAELARMEYQLYLGSLVASRYAGMQVTAITAFPVRDTMYALARVGAQSIETAVRNFALDTSLIVFPGKSMSTLPTVEEDVDLTLRRACVALGTAAHMPAAQLPIADVPVVASTRVASNTSSLAFHVLEGETVFDAVTGTLARVGVFEAISSALIDDIMFDLLTALRKPAVPSEDAQYTHRRVNVSLDDTIAVPLVYALTDDPQAVVQSFAGMLGMQFSDNDTEALVSRVTIGAGSRLTLEQAEAVQAELAARLAAAAASQATANTPADAASGGTFADEIAPAAFNVSVQVGSSIVDVVLQPGEHIANVARAVCVSNAAKLTMAYRVMLEAAGDAVSDELQETYVESGFCASQIEQVIRSRAAVVFAA